MAGNDSEIPTPAEILPAEHWASYAAAREPEDDADSALGTETASSTVSITSSILNYREINGRTYHSERGNALYWAANDEKQNETMDILHHLLMLHFDGKIYLSPLGKEIKKALDIGCGTGIWAMDFADEFPGCEITGTDISPIQSTWVPPNLKFEIEDCTEAWTFEANSFDYVHIRWLIGSIADWTALFKEAYRVLKPGGYLESFEPSDRIESEDDSVRPTDALGQWAALFRAGGKVIDRPFNVYDDDMQQKAFDEAGFVDVTVKNIVTPIGRWPADRKLKEVGEYAHLAFENDIEGFILFLATTLGWKRDDILVYVAQLRREIRSPRRRAQYRQRVVFGRKPERGGKEAEES